MAKPNVLLKRIGFRVSKPIRDMRLIDRMLKIMLRSVVSALRRAKRSAKEPSNIHTPFSFFPLRINLALMIVRITKPKTTTVSAMAGIARVARLI